MRKQLLPIMVSFAIAMFTSIAASANDEGQTGGQQDGKQITVTIDESGLSKKTISAQDGSYSYTYNNAAVGVVKVTLSDIPTTLADLQNLVLPRGMKDIHDTPYLAPALMICAVSQRFVNEQECKAMINYIAKAYNDTTVGAADFYKSDWMQIGQYNAKYMEAMRSYFNGATKRNSYTPSQPVTLEMELTKWSYTANNNHIKLWIKSSVKSSKQEYGIWMEDSDGDGRYDYFYPTTFMTLSHGLGAY